MNIKIETKSKNDYRFPEVGEFFADECVNPMTLYLRLVNHEQRFCYVNLNTNKLYFADNMFEKFIFKQIGELKLIVSTI